jgi:hypothetical protein
MLPRSIAACAPKPEFCKPLVELGAVVWARAYTTTPTAHAAAANPSNHLRPDERDDAAGGLVLHGE